mmetsp:Transcript_15867/g.44603  ORF Transcript_15867/g.44603 Transcript_15867/m.44603 type:complete len:213 (-) Transcript_15867:3361-3999(-)
MTRKFPKSRLSRSPSLPLSPSSATRWSFSSRGCPLHAFRFLPQRPHVAPRTRPEVLTHVWLSSARWRLFLLSDRWGSPTPTILRLRKASRVMCGISSTPSSFLPPSWRHTSGGRSRRTFATTVGMTAGAWRYLCESLSAAPIAQPAARASTPVQARSPALIFQPLSTVRMDLARGGTTEVSPLRGKPTRAYRPSCFCSPFCTRERKMRRCAN